MVKGMEEEREWRDVGPVSFSRLHPGMGGRRVRAKRVIGLPLLPTRRLPPIGGSEVSFPKHHWFLVAGMQS